MRHRPLPRWLTGWQPSIRYLLPNSLSSVPASLIPTNDAARLQALAGYKVLDARSEKILDDVVAATAQLFGVSNAMLSLIKRQRSAGESPV